MCMTISATVYMGQILYGKAKNAGGVLDMWKLDMCLIFEIVENNRNDQKIENVENLSKILL